MSDPVMTPPERVVAGDQFIDDKGNHIWTALYDATVVGAEVHIAVQFAVDGGCSTRVWEAGGSHLLTVRSA